MTGMGTLATTGAAASATGAGGGAGIALGNNGGVAVMIGGDPRDRFIPSMAQMPAAQAMAARAKANTVNEEVREVCFTGATRIPAVRCRVWHPGSAPVGRELSAVLATCSAEKEAADRFQVSLINGEATGSGSAFFITAYAAATTVNSLTGIAVLDPSTNAHSC